MNKSIDKDQFGGLIRSLARRLLRSSSRGRNIGRTSRLIPRIGGKQNAGKIIGKQIGLNVKKTKLGIEPPTITYEPLGPTWMKTTPMKGTPAPTDRTVYRTSAKNFNRWKKSKKVNLDDPKTAVIEIASHPSGHMTVKQRHLMGDNGEDISFSFDENTNRPNLKQYRFDDSHQKTDWTLDEVKEALSLNQWEGTPIAENPQPIHFENITDGQAQDLVNFIDDNTTRDIYVHCLQGKSRSGAVDKFLRDFYGYKGPEGSNTDMYSPEVYKALVKAYMNKHNGISYYH